MIVSSWLPLPLHSVPFCLQRCFLTEGDVVLPSAIPGRPVACLEIGWSPGMLLIISQCTGQRPSASNHWSKMSLVPLLRNPWLQGSWSADLFSALRSPCGVDCGTGYRKMKVSLVIQIYLHSEFDSWKFRIQGVSTASVHSLSKHRQTDRHTHTLKHRYQIGWLRFRIKSLMLYQFFSFDL